MCCSWNSWKVGLLPGLMAALLLLPSWSGAAGRDYLEIRSVAGYSRFEIESGDVVEFHTGGVEFDYAGYNVSAEELRKKFQYQSSDKQIASFIIKNINIIEEMLPVTTSKSYLAQKEKFTKIYTQSNKILNIKYE